MTYRNVTMWGNNYLDEDPTMPINWTPETPLAILGEVDGHDPYNSAKPTPNHVLTPVHPNYDDTDNIVLRYGR